MTRRFDLTRASRHIRRTLASAALAAMLMAVAPALPTSADHCYSDSPIQVGNIYDPTYTGVYDCHTWGLEETGSILIDPIQPPVAETGSSSVLYAIDSDGDGLTDGEEISTHGTNPSNWDTDGDGFGDGTEVYAGSSPHDPYCTPYGCG